MTVKHPALAHLALGYAPLYDKQRQVMGTRLSLLPLKPDAPLAAAPLLAAARARGTALSYGSFGIATPPHLIGERIGLEAGNRMTHVPYRVSAQAFPDILSGALDFAILDAVAMTPHITAGRLHALALNGTQRSLALPDVPTLREAGLPFDAVGWHGAFALAATPTLIVKRLNAAFNAATARPRVREAIIAGSSIPEEPPLSAAEWPARFRREVTAWGEVARAARIEVE